MCVSLLQIRSTLLAPPLMSQVMLLFSRPVRDLMPEFSGSQMSFEDDENNSATIIHRQHSANTDIDTHEKIQLLPSLSTAVVECKDEGPQCMACRQTLQDTISKDRPHHNQDQETQQDYHNNDT